MKGPELVDLTSRFRFAESCLGIMGCIFISYAVCMPDWLDGKGLWSRGNESSPDDSQTQGHIIQGESRLVSSYLFSLRYFKGMSVMLSCCHIVPLEIMQCLMAL